MKIHERLQKDAEYAKQKKLLLILHCKTETIIGMPFEITEDYFVLNDGWIGFTNVYGMPRSPAPDPHYKTVVMSTLCSVEFSTPDKLNPTQ